MTQKRTERRTGSILYGLKTSGAFGAGLIMLTALGPLLGELPASLAVPPVRTPAASNLGAANDAGGITNTEYQKVVEGMSITEVTRLIGQPGELQQSATADGVPLTAYVWSNSDGSGAGVVFRDGEMVFKTQNGLQ